MNKLDCKQWFGQVVASEESIKAAIKKLGRQPKSAEELQTVIDKQKEEAIKSMLDEINQELPEPYDPKQHFVE